MSCKISYNESFKTGTFPDNWKLTYISPIFKKKGLLNSTNNHPVIALLIVSELFEKAMKIETNNLISICLHLTYVVKEKWLQELLPLIEKWKKEFS